MIRLALSPRKSMTDAGGTSYYDYLTNTYEVGPYKRIRINLRQWYIIAFDDDNVLTSTLLAMRDDTELRELDWEGLTMFTDSVGLVLLDRLNIPPERIPDTWTRREVFLRVLRRLLPHFDVAKMRQDIADGRRSHIDLVTAEMDL